MTLDARVSSSFWYVWLEIAVAHELEARRIHEPAGDALGEDTRASLVAITASAFALDALYGVAFRHVPAALREVWQANDTSRGRRVAEGLKRAFGIGKVMQARLADLDWLFDRRDEAVHFVEEPRPPQAHPLGGNTSVDRVTYSHPNALRAVRLALDVSEACITSKKIVPELQSWAERRQTSLRGLIERSA